MTLYPKTRLKEAREKRDEVDDRGLSFLSFRQGVKI